jgi:formylglycine-generating enzyme required for sulfatase activity
MGSDPQRDYKVVRAKGPLDDELPQHSVTLPAYEIARYPVTVAEYACFVRSGHPAPMAWQTQVSKLDHPVVRMSWHDAVAYTAWLSERTGERWRLPTEAEWEKAARGTDGRIYPWGDTFDSARCNTYESGIRATSPVGSYPSGASPYGVQDMAGNVSDWTGSLKLPYPYTPSGEREDPNSPDVRVARGGSWVGGAGLARSAYRGNNMVPVLVNDIIPGLSLFKLVIPSLSNSIIPGLFHVDLGFRVVRAAPNS